MANLIHRTQRDDTGSLLRLYSVNTPDYDQNDWLTNPDLAGVSGVPEYYWKVTGVAPAGDVVEMDAGEKAAVDVTRLATAKTARKQALDDRGSAYLDERYPQNDQVAMRVLYSTAETWRPQLALYLKQFIDWSETVYEEVETQKDAVDAAADIAAVDAIVLDEATLTSNDPGVSVDDALAIVETAASTRMSGARAVWVSASQVGIGEAGKLSVVSDFEGDGPIAWVGQLIADLTSSGAGGLDTGTEAPDTWYAVYVIADSSGTNPVAAMLSETYDSEPTMPSGYDMHRLIWFVRNDSAEDLLEFYQTGRNETRRCWWDQPSEDLKVLDSGNATTYTSIDCSSLMPPLAELGVFQSRFMTGTGGQSSNQDKALLRPTGSSKSLYQFHVGVQSDMVGSFQHEMPVGADQTIEYRCSYLPNRYTCVVIGWEIDL